MYADDLVLICDNEEDLHKAIYECRCVCDDIGMEANVSKCATMSM